MNRKMVFYLLGKILCIEAGLMLLPLAFSLIYRESEAIFAFLVTIVVSAILGILLVKINNPKDKTIFAKEGFVIVALAWIVLSLVGAVPFVLSGAIPNYIDAFFETVSGFTTTGASILTDVEAITSKGILFWRSFTHWIGGMGILMFVILLLPISNENSGTPLSISKGIKPAIYEIAWHNCSERTSKQWSATMYFLVSILFQIYYSFWAQCS